MSVSLIAERKYGDLPVSIYASNEAMGKAAAADASEIIQDAIQQKGVANIIIATGNSQLTFLAALRGMKDIHWPVINIFHMDEYVDIDPEHPASFPNFLHKHIIDYINPRAFYPVPGQAKDIEKACREYEALLRAHPADLCALGIGENGHLAFNDPPYADPNDPVWVKVIELAETARKQQVNEGHFASLAEVPKRAITLTIPALFSARRVLAIVPEARKAEVVYKSLRDPISSDCPGTFLRRLSYSRLYLDKDSAAKLG